MFHSGFHFSGEAGTAVFTMEGQEVPLILAILIGAAAAEILLASKQDRRLGLILPGAWLIWTLAALISRLAALGGPASLGEWGRLLAIAFALENVLTLVLLAVYGLCRMGRRRRVARQVKRTRIEDL